MFILGFVNKIHHDDANYIARYFDQIMILYNFIGRRQNVSISMDGTNTAFEIVFDNEVEASSLYEFLNGTQFNIYQNRYTVEMQLSGVTILTKIYKVVP
jgi:hypothetical protein